MFKKKTASRPKGSQRALSGGRGHTVAGPGCAINTIGRSICTFRIFSSFQPVSAATLWGHYNHHIISQLNLKKIKQLKTANMLHLSMKVASNQPVRKKYFNSAIVSHVVPPEQPASKLTVVGSCF
jgi:hypothetical protein